MAKAQPQAVPAFLTAEQEEEVVAAEPDQAAMDGQEAMQTPPAGGSQEASPDAPKAAEKSATLVAVKAVVNDFYNPFTRTQFPRGQVVEDVVMDGWLESQMAAGFIVRV